MDGKIITIEHAMVILAIAPWSHVFSQVVLKSAGSYEPWDLNLKRVFFYFSGERKLTLCTYVYVANGVHITTLSLYLPSQPSPPLRTDSLAVVCLRHSRSLSAVSLATLSLQSYCMSYQYTIMLLYTKLAVVWYVFL